MHNKNMATDPEEFWQQRDSLTPTTDAATGDGSHQLVLLADTTNPEVRAEYQPVYNALSGFDCLNTCPAGSLHLTIKLFDVVADPSTSGSWSPAVRRTDRTIANVLSDKEPFEVAITRFNLFPDVVYGEVADDGSLAELNRAVCDHPEVAAVARDGEEFIPHLTFGYFQDDTDFEALIEFLETNRQLSLPQIPVDQLELAACEVGERPPAYDRIATYQL